MSRGPAHGRWPRNTFVKHSFHLLIHNYCCVLKTIRGRLCIRHSGVGRRRFRKIDIRNTAESKSGPQTCTVCVLYPLLFSPLTSSGAINSVGGNAVSICTRRLRTFQKPFNNDNYDYPYFPALGRM